MLVLLARTFKCEPLSVQLRRSKLYSQNIWMSEKSPVLRWMDTPIKVISTVLVEESFHSCGDNYQLFKVYKIALLISGRKDESPRGEIGLVLVWGHGTFTTIGTRQVFGYTSRTVVTCHIRCFLHWLWIVISLHSHDTSKYNFSNKVWTFSRSLWEKRQLKHVHSIPMEGESFSAYFCLHREIIREPFPFCILQETHKDIRFPSLFSPHFFCPVCLFV